MSARGECSPSTICVLPQEAAHPSGFLLLWAKNSFPKEGLVVSRLPMQCAPAIELTTMPRRKIKFYTFFANLLAGIFSFHICSLVLLPVLAPSLLQAEIRWQGWSEDLFSQAQVKNKLVILDLEAVWCHWCHVMEKETYSDPEVARIIEEHFIAVRVDQDSRPDLGVRYQDYGWPATIIFNSKGEELSKNAGFFPAHEMEVLLKKLVAKPTPEENIDQPIAEAASTQASGLISENLKTELEDRHERARDRKLGALSLAQKYLDADTIEYSMLRASLGNAEEKHFVQISLNNNRKLIDQTWGGVYQYSTHYDWDHPHYEKIMLSQSGNLRLYASTYLLWGEEKDLVIAKNILRYLDTFLKSPEGAFYTSQDADVVKGEHSKEYFDLDDAGRRAQGMPAIDKNTYARQNGWAIRALASLYAASGDAQALTLAKNAATWMKTHRQRSDGGFSHTESDKAGPVLGDTLSMGYAALALYTVTSDREWLNVARNAAFFIEKNFRENDKIGYISSVVPSGSALKPFRVIDENIDLSRFANLLFRYTGDESFKRMSERALRYLAQPTVATDRICESGILLALRELGEDPLHITVVAAKSDPNAQALFQQALRYPSLYKRTEWYDKSEGPLPNTEVEYPVLDRAAAYVCTQKRCSIPIFDSAKLAATVDRILGKKPN